MLAAETKAVRATETVSLIADFPFAWRQMVEPLEPFLQAVGVRLSEQVQAFDPEIGGYAEYALSGQGKQLRPLLVGLSGSGIGPVQEAHITVAVIIEMVHLATLVHDDVIDEAAMRRSRPTLAAHWGNDISVLLGDCLFAHALKLAASFPTPDICRAVAAATNTVCAGEILQTQQRRNFQLSQAAYFKVLAMKTGELFALSCELGASLSGANPAQRLLLRQYGLALGTAYQLYDDCVDLFGSEASVGKSLGTDLAKGKLTLPLLLLLDRLAPTERARVQRDIETWKPDNSARLLKLLERHQTLGSSRQVVHRYLQTARQALAGLPPSDGRAGLIGLAEFLAQQTDALGGPA